MRARPLRVSGRHAALFTTVLTAGFVASQSTPPDPARMSDDREVVYYDFLDENGELTGGAVVQPRDVNAAGTAATPAPVTTLHAGAVPFGARTRGSQDNRVDLVFVGDGYTQAELPDFHAHVDTVVQGLFGTEPLGRYVDVLAVHRVDVVSAESGVDNDPVQGIDRDTALNMQYWCGGTERLLCVDVGAAYSFANNAPDVDQVIALANSTKYGGAGYTNSNLSTSSGANGSALEIVKHELGHSLGNLADEYTYGGPTTWQGGEPSRANVSTFDAASMAAQGAKWADWLGESVQGFDGTIGTFEGANYSQLGIYRPSNNSLMRNLGRRFNLVNAEEIIKEIYREVSPVESASDPDLDYTSADILTVTPITVGGAQLPVRWEVDGVELTGFEAPALDLSTLGLGSCAATITATVVDDTDWVKDEAYRAQRMTETLTYTINEAWQTEVCVGTPNSTGNAAGSFLLGSPSVSAQDLTLGAFGGPPSAPILFFYGDTQVSVPLGPGVLCAAGNQQRVAIGFFDGLGVATHVVDWQSGQVTQPGTTIAPGTTWLFQGWYRDTDAMGAPTFNLTGAVEVTFCD